MVLRRAILAAAVAASWLANPSARAAQDSGEIVFAAWNVRNYALAPVAGPDGQTGAPPKSPASAEAVVKTVAKIAPDILGLCEIGSRRDLDEMQRRLAEAGLSLPHAAWVDGADVDRHLALLSRFPIVSEQHDTAGEVTLGGLPRRVQRGFLDCTIGTAPHFRLRVLGAHLKSRRVVPGLDQAELRRSESLLLRKRIDSILGEDPATPLLLFGDLNDSKRSPVIASLLGAEGTERSMTDIAPRDEHGDNWTYHWTDTDEYSRVDYIMVSPALRPLVVRQRSHIPRSRDWLEASDHRPLVVTLRIPPAPAKP